MTDFTYKSRVIKIFDFHKILVENIPDRFVVNEEKLKKDMKRQISLRGTKVDAGIISMDDVVLISCISENKKFARDHILVNIGKGLWNSELESAMVGMSKGETKDFAVDEKSTVTVTVHGITHTVLPELSENEQKECRRICIDRQIERFIDEGEDADMASAMICMKAAELSEFELNAEELQNIEESVRSTDTSDMEEMIRSIFLGTFKNAIIGAALMEKDGQYLKEEEWMKAQDYCTLREFKDARYADYYIKMVDAYVADEYKKALNPERR